MGRFSVTFSNLTGSDLSDIQHTGGGMMQNIATFDKWNDLTIPRKQLPPSWCVCYAMPTVL